ncbi:MAG TPA: hypothetical protein VJ810_20670 [Blastocatellia bacterium]|nr:hypothetical protein [Blastocatellia bacterium]
MRTGERKGAIASKPLAARRAIKNLSQEWHEIILQALGTEDAERLADISLNSIERFIDLVDAQIHSQ